VFNVSLGGFAESKKINELFNAKKPIKDNKQHNMRGKKLIVSIRIWLEREALEKYSLSAPFLDYLFCRDSRSRALFLASRLERAGKKKTRQGKRLEALDYFLSSMKIHEKYSKFSLDLMASYIQVGQAILSDEVFTPTSYARIALRCLSRALAIQKVYYHHYQRIQKSPDDTAHKEITALDIATLSCYIARAFLLIDDVNAAHEQASYALRLLKKYEEEAIKRTNSSNKLFKKESMGVLAMCYLTIASALANMMTTDMDKLKAMRYYRLAVDLQEQMEISSLDTIIAHSELASFLYDIGDLDGALWYNEAAFRILEQKSVQEGSDCYGIRRSVSILLNNIALIHKDMAK